MIEVQDTATVDAFEDAVEATAYIATVHVRYGELVLPPRIREHIADGPVVVHLLRGEDDVAVHTATLTSRSTLAGIEWPEDVLPRTSLPVLCPRGSQGHDIAVRLPDLPEPLQFEYAEDDREAAPVDEEIAELVEAAQDGTGWSTYRREPVADEVDPLDLVETSVAGELDVDVTAELDPWDAVPTWPGDEDLTPQEETDLLPIVVPDVREPEPGTVYSAAVAVAKTRRRWFSPLVDAVADTIRWSARWEEEHALTLARVALGSLSLAVLTGVGVLAALGVTR